MAYPHNVPDSTPSEFRRFAPSNDSPGAAWLIVLMILGGLLVVVQVAKLAASPAESSWLVRMLDSRTPSHQREGYLGPPAAPAVAVEAEAPVSVAAPTPVPTAAPTPTPAVTRHRVANTDGLGVVLHTAPRRDARVPRGIVEGAVVQVLEWEGSGWARVRAPDGQEGWVGAAYLAPAD